MSDTNDNPNPTTPSRKSHQAWSGTGANENAKNYSNPRTASTVPTSASSSSLALRSSSSPYHTAASPYEGLLHYDYYDRNTSAAPRMSPLTSLPASAGSFNQSSHTPYSDLLRGKKLRRRRRKRKKKLSEVGVSDDSISQNLTRALEAQSSDMDCIDKNNDKTKKRRMEERNEGPVEELLHEEKIAESPIEKVGVSCPDADSKKVVIPNGIGKSAKRKKRKIMPDLTNWYTNVALQGSQNNSPNRSRVEAESWRDGAESHCQLHVYPYHPMVSISAHQALDKRQVDLSSYKYNGSLVGVQSKTDENKLTDNENAMNIISSKKIVKSFNNSRKSNL